MYSVSCRSFRPRSILWIWLAAAWSTHRHVSAAQQAESAQWMSHYLPRVDWQYALPLHVDTMVRRTCISNTQGHFLYCTECARFCRALTGEVSLPMSSSVMGSSGLVKLDPYPFTCNGDMPPVNQPSSTSRNQPEHAAHLLSRTFLLNNRCAPEKQGSFLCPLSRSSWFCE